MVLRNCFQLLVLPVVVFGGGVEPELKQTPGTPEYYAAMQERNKDRVEQGESIGGPCDCLEAGGGFLRSKEAKEADALANRNMSLKDKVEHLKKKIEITPAKGTTFDEVTFSTMTELIRSSDNQEVMTFEGDPGRGFLPLNSVVRLVYVGDADGTSGVTTGGDEFLKIGRASGRVGPGHRRGIVVGEDSRKYLVWMVPTYMQVRGSGEWEGDGLPQFDLVLAPRNELNKALR